MRSALALLRLVFVCSISLLLFSTPTAAWEHDLGVNDVVCLATGTMSSPIIVANGMGGWYVVWYDERISDGEFYAQRLDSEGSPMWAASGVLAVHASSNVYDLEVAVGESGDLYIGYICASRAFVQKLGPEGTLDWGSLLGVELTPSSTGDQSELEIISDGWGGVIAGFTDMRNSATTGKDIWTQRVYPDGSLLMTSYGKLVTAGANTQTSLFMVLSEPGIALYFWNDYRNSGTTSWDIYGQSVNVLTGDRLWGSNGTPICNAAEGQYLSSVCPDGFGGAFLAWNDSRTSANSYDIYAQRVLPVGVGMWYLMAPGSGLPVCALGGAQESCRIAPDGDGGAVFVWSDLRSDSYDGTSTYAQYIGSTGGAQWTTNGVIVFPVDGSCYPAGNGVVDGGEDSWFILGQRDGTLYAQKLGRDGGRDWAYAGTPLSNAIWYLQGGSFVADGRGGLIAAWADFRFYPDFGIFAQRMDRWGLPGDASPTLYQVIDRPGDQGGEAVVSWSPSYLDAFAEPFIDHYTIWMQFEGWAKTHVLLGQKAATELSGLTGLQMEAVLALDKSGWAYAGQQEAYCFNEYAFHAPTYGDSTLAGTPLTNYKVLAHDVSKDAYWESIVMGGYSVDNLSPEAPVELMAEREGVDVALEWTPSGVNDEDVAEYLIYRAETPKFPLGPATLVGTSVDIVYRDETAPSSALYYRVVARDIHGNESGPSNPAAVPAITAVGDPVPRAFALLDAVPNPFNPHTTIAYDLPQRAEVVLQIYDARGRLVRTLVRGWQEGPQRHEEVWNGTDDGGRPVASGVYLYRLHAGAFEQTKRMALVR